jgi:hypothetical protein
MSPFFLARVAASSWAASSLKKKKTKTLKRQQPVYLLYHEFVGRIAFRLRNKIEISPVSVLAHPLYTVTNAKTSEENQNS